MSRDLLDQVVDGRIRKTRELLSGKGAVYATADDRFHNFNAGAALMRCTPEKALLGYMAKHLVSIVDLIEALDRGEVAPAERWDEKLGDAIAYLHLLEGLVALRFQPAAPPVDGEEIRYAEGCRL